MLDLQRRHAELFRIRLGEKASDGRPVALRDCMRITSRNFEVVTHIATRYGGVVGEWQDQHEARIPVTELSVVVPPGDSVTQWWEQWRRKTGMPVCTHRCDGITNYITGEPCSCPAVDDRLNSRSACSPTTRLSVFLPDVPVIGAGVLVSNGRIAAETLAQSVSVLQAGLDRGLMIPAVLRVVPVESSGRSFVVPRLEVVGVSLNELAGAELPGRSLPAPAGSAHEVGNSSPPAIEPGGAPSLTVTDTPSGSRFLHQEMTARGYDTKRINAILKASPKPFTYANAQEVLASLPPRAEDD